MKTRKAIGGGFFKHVGTVSATFGLAGIMVLSAEPPDLSGPKLVAAIIGHIAVGTGTTGSNTIDVLLSEPLNFATAQNTNNFTLIRIGNTNRIPILRAVYGTRLGILLTVDTTNADWAAQEDYVLTVNNVRDTRGNIIAPDSQIPVLRPLPTQPLLSANAIWSHHLGYGLEPGIYDQPWERPDYVESPWWEHAAGPFCEEITSELQETNWTACLGPCKSLEISGREPALFRTSFFWPTNLASVGLFITTEADDAMIVYLNGREIWRNKLSPQITRLSASPGFDIIWEFPPGCMVNQFLFVTNLLSGTNWLAVGVVKALVGNNVEAFAFELAGGVFRAPALPNLPPPTLNVAQLESGSARLWWSGYGYALESVTNLTGDSNSHPLGPWQEVPNMANPYTNSVVEPQRFFRLKK
jgi:hypothetical protein